MPKIIIREIDNTKASTGEYSNFSVVVPGFKGNKDASGSTETDYPKLYKDTDTTSLTYGKWVYVGKSGDNPEVVAIDENDVYECSSQKDFVKYIGKDPETVIIGGAQVPHTKGNQIAYELLGLGYTVLFKLITLSEGKTAKSILEDSTFWGCLKDRSTYDFRYICTGSVASADAYKNIIDVATHNSAETIDNEPAVNGRGDCCALIDVDETDTGHFTGTSNVAKIRNYVNNLKVSDASILNKYAAIFAPTVTYSGIDSTTYGNKTFPASFHFLACAAYARNVKNFAEWYAVAGYNRGVSDYSIESTSMKLGEIEINALQPRTITTGTQEYSVNLITNIRKNYYLWGSRTAHKLADGLVASHFLNIRDLCSSLKKVVWNACKELTFDPNSDLLWANFQNKIRPTLEKMKSDQGIKDYKIIKVKVTEKALLTAKIRIVPIEPVEDFEISIYLEDSIAGVTTEE